MNENEENVRFVDLGWVNGWRKTPKVVSVCRGKGHDTQRSNEGRCVEKISCPVCGYVYRVDSSD